MQQLFFLERGKVEWRDIESPEIVEPDDALVRPLAVATCDLDTGLLHSDVPFPGPFPLGHEGVGEVLEVGDEVTSVKAGDRVIIPFQISCGRCGRCARGLTASCETVNPGAMYGLEPFGGPWGGFLTDAVRVPFADHMLVPLPDGLDPVAVASLSDNVCDGWRTVAPFVGAPAEESVLVLGGNAPSIPFYSVAAAKALGVGTIDYLDFAGASPDGSTKASRLGANVVDGADALKGQRYTITVCSALEPDAMKAALKATEPDGTCVVNAIYFDDAMPLPMFSMYTRGVRLVTGRVNARAVIPEALASIVSGALAPEGVTDQVVSWDECADALVAEPHKFVIRR